jgi:hypothetical protein
MAQQDQQTLITSIADITGLQLQHHTNWREVLVAHINSLINENFEELINLLYRIDVNETTLKQSLERHPENNSAEIIVSLIIERQTSKLSSRNRFSGRNDVSDEERW